MPAQSSPSKELRSDTSCSLLRTGPVFTKCVCCVVGKQRFTSVIRVAMTTERAIREEVYFMPPYSCSQFFLACLNSPFDEEGLPNAWWVRLKLKRGFVPLRQGTMY